MDNRLEPDTQRRLLLLALPAAAALAACGGGGGGAAGSAATAPALSLLAGSVGGLGDLDGPAGINRLYFPAAVVADAQGVLFIADAYNHTIRKLDRAGVMSTVAGKPGVTGSADGPADVARFQAPGGIALDGSGGLFVADSWNNTIRRVSASGEVTTVAGLAGQAGKPAAFGVGQAGAQARFNRPIGLAFDSQGGKLYIADQGNHAIRILTADGLVFLGAGPHTGLSGAAASLAAPADALFKNPTAVALDANAEVLWISDTGNNVVRKWLTTSFIGVVTATSPGPGGVTFPQALAVNPSSNEALVIGLSNNVYRVGPQIVNASVAKLTGSNATGSQDGPIAEAGFDTFSGSQGISGGLCFDTFGQRFVLADPGNHLVRTITAKGNVDLVGTLAGQRLALEGNTNGIGADARFFNPVSLAATHDGSALVGEWGSTGTLRRVAPSGAVSDVMDVTTQGVTPRFAAEASNGDLYVADFSNMLVVRKGIPPLQIPSSSSSIQDGPPGVCSFGRIRGLAVDSLGRALLVDATAPAVRMLTSNGVLSRIAGQYGKKDFHEGDALTEAVFHTPIDLVLAADGTIFVLDAGNSMVLRVAAAGNGRNRVSLVAANFEDPRALALDSAGNLYVAEGQSQTIVRIDSSGLRKTVAGLPGRRGFSPGGMPGALSFGPRAMDPSDPQQAIGMRVIDDRLLITMEQAVVQISPLPA